MIDEDTRPTQTVPQVMLNDVQQPSALQRLIGFLMLLGAAGLTFATVLLVMNPAEETTPPAPTQNTQNEEVIASPLPIEDSTPVVLIAPAANDDTPPTIDPETANALLQAPLQSYNPIDAIRVNSDLYDPFTIIPDRPRNEIITYEVVQGDTIQAIADRFNLTPETIAWSNPRRIVQVLRPGDILEIPPVDGVLINAIGSQRTITDYTEQYKLDNPYTVLDSEYNNLPGFTPDTVPPSGTQIFFPGGEAESIVWVAEIEVSDGSGSGGSGQAGVATVRFQPNQPGDCGNVAIGGGTFWSNPIPSGAYTITRGYSPVVHPGIDLAGTTGTPIAAANGGTVIFAGFNGFGYGNMVAIIHGPNMTVYGHMENYYAQCGQVVDAGTIIGTMGSTGNSSGPHLHFEIRGRAGNTYIPLNPAATIAF